MLRVLLFLEWARKHACVFSPTQLCPTLCNPINCSPPQAPLSMGFSRQEYWSGLPFPPPGDLLNPGTEPVSLVSPALAGVFFTTESPGKPMGKRDISTNENFLCEKKTCALLLELFLLVFNCPLTQNNPYAKEVYLGAASSGAL